MTDNFDWHEETAAKLVTTPIAIIGMSAIFPQASNLTEYWQNILRKVDTIIDVPPSRWNIADYYDPDPSKPDKIYCKRGGFIPDIEFDPVEFGLPPNILEATDVSQLLSLLVARDALEDAGYCYAANGETGRPKIFERTGVILGFVGVSTKLFVPLISRLQYPIWEKVLRSCGLAEPDIQKVVEKIKLAYVGWEENSFPGTIGNVVAGRIANRFDLGGTNFVVDAACASSLAAIKMAMSELVEGRADMMLAGGLDTDNSISSYICFSKTPAFTKDDHVRPFDADSGGMMVGEGLGMVVLKRLADAERDGDRIYAVIKGIGASSDGRFKSIYAPRPEGQALALRRAYQEAGFSPATVTLVEAHGTGTLAGDPAEFAGLKEVFSEAVAGKAFRRPTIALGSVKSQIGHTKAAAGTASLIKVSMALYHKILPPTINVTKPSPKLAIETTPFYLNTESRPWLRLDSNTPRRAGVSSFGFGGTNFHVVLEEYEPEHTSAYRRQPVAQQVLLSAPTPAELQSLCQKTLENLQSEQGEQHFVNLVKDSTTISQIPASYARLGFVADALAEALKLLQISIELLRAKSSQETWEHPRGIWYRRTGLELAGKVVALFPGQGSQYLEMGRELAMNFPPLRQAYAKMDSLLAEAGLDALSPIVFPPPAFDPATRQEQEKLLQQTEHAQPAIGVFSWALYRLFQQAGFRADFTAGHSFGELTALWAAGVLEDEDYFRLVIARGQAMAAPKDPNFDAGVMLAAKGDAQRIRELASSLPDITLANWNSNSQVVLAGTKAAITHAQQVLLQSGISSVLLPVSAAFHTSLVGHAHRPFAEAIERATFHKPAIPVFSNSKGAPYPQEPSQIRRLLSEHILNPVLFKQEIEAIYAQGGFCFIEFGPKNVLTNLVHNILADQPHLAIAINPNTKGDSDRQLREAVVQLRVAGLELGSIDPYQLPLRAPEPKKKSKATVKLNGGLYVSEKTRTAFEQALNDGWKISQSSETVSTSSNSNPEKSHPSLPGTLAGSDSLPTLPTTTVRPSAQPALSSLGTSTSEASELQPDTLTKQGEIVSARSSSTTVIDLDHILAQFQEHQTQMVRTHEQYLQNEAEYVRTFSLLTQQEIGLLSNSSLSVQQLAQLNTIFDSIERSMVRLHDHQAETRRVHEQYLRQQGEFTQSFIRFLHSRKTLSESSIGPEEVRQSPAEPSSASVPAAHSSVKGNGSTPTVNSPTTTIAEAVKSTTVIPHPADNGAQPVQAAPSVGLDAGAIRQAFMEIVSEKTGYPTEMLEPAMDMEADLGIDSIKRVEILGAMQSRFPELPKVSPDELAELRTLGQVAEMMTMQQARIPEPPAATATLHPADNDSQPVQAAPSVGLDAGAIRQAFMEIVSEKTGYPTEMLEPAMDMEADLGIDSIKRVEILGAMQSRFPELPKVSPDELAELRTLGQVVEHLGKPVGQAQPDEAVAMPATKPVPEPAQVVIPRREIIRKILPQPDRLRFTLPDGHICLLTDDGTSITADLANALTSQNWKVVVLSFPEALVDRKNALPPSVEHIRLAGIGEEHLKNCLDEIQHKFGPVAVFIHLHPDKIHRGSRSISRNGGFQFDDSEKMIVKQVFLIAKYLKAPLTAAAQKGRAAFITVVRLDGKFGLGQDHIFSPISGGLFGLVKTLNLEWQAVYCRGIDISPALDSPQSVQRILDELYDPNHLIIEVGYSLPSRSVEPLAPAGTAPTQTVDTRHTDPVPLPEAERSTLVVSENSAGTHQDKVHSL